MFRYILRRGRLAGHRMWCCSSTCRTTIESTSTTGCTLKNRQLHISHQPFSAHDYRQQSTERDEERRLKYVIAKANESFEREDFSQAVFEYDDALSQDPDNFDALTGKAASLEKLGRLDECIACATRVLQVAQRTHADAMVFANEFRRLGEVYLKQKRFVEAHTALRGFRTTLRTGSHNTSEILEEMHGLPFSVGVTREKGRGLFATKDLQEGDLLVIEPPLVSCLDFESSDVPHCAQCLRQLKEVQFGYSSEETRSALSEMPPDSLAQLKRELAEQFAPPLKPLSYGPFTFCSSQCEQKARKEWLDYLLPLISSKDERLRFVLPSVFRTEDAPRDDSLKGLAIREQACIELVTLILARNEYDPETWNRWVSRLAYAEIEPAIPLLQHEKLQLSALHEIFPSQKSLLTESNFKRMKSAVDLNAFSVETNAITVMLGITSDVVGDAPAPDARQLALHVEIDDVAVKGHALYRIGSFMNHSCDPNVGMVSPSFTSAAQWTCIKPISKGAELLDSYIPLHDSPTQTRKDRQHVLNLHYKFDCKCSLCIQN